MAWALVAVLLAADPHAVVTIVAEKTPLATALTDELQLRFPQSSIRIDPAAQVSDVAIFVSDEGATVRHLRLVVNGEKRLDERFSAEADTAQAARMLAVLIEGALVYDLGEMSQPTRPATASATPAADPIPFPIPHPVVAKRMRVSLGGAVVNYPEPGRWTAGASLALFGQIASRLALVGVLRTEAQTASSAMRTHESLAAVSGCVTLGDEPQLSLAAGPALGLVRYGRSDLSRRLWLLGGAAMFEASHSLGSAWRGWLRLSGDLMPRYPRYELLGEAVLRRGPWRLGTEAGVAYGW